MQVRTPPERPADGVVGCVYESFVPGVWHRWLVKEILWFCFRRDERLSQVYRPRLLACGR